MTNHMRDSDQPTPAPDETLADIANALNAALDDAPMAARNGEIASLLATMRAAQATSLAAAETLSMRDQEALWATILQEVTPRPVAAVTPAHAVGFGATYPIGNRLLPVVRSRGYGEATGHEAGRDRGSHSGSGSRDRSIWRTLGSWCSMALIAAMLIAMGSVVWSLRPGADGEHGLLASATSLAIGTALASPSPVAEQEHWLRWPVPEDCNVAPMPHEAYARIMQAQPDISGRSYGVAGAPTQADAIAAADAARRHFACEAFSMAAEERTLSSPAYTFFQSYSAARTVTDTALAETDLTHGMMLSATIGPGVPQDYVGILEGLPQDAELMDPSIAFGNGEYDDLVQVPAGQEFYFGLTFNPEQATVLADGRIAIPATMLGFALDRRNPPADLDVVAPPLYVMANDSGRWVVDEVLVYCPFAGCGPVWQMLAEKAGVPLPTLTIPVPWTMPSGGKTATPAASPTVDRTATPVG